MPRGATYLHELPHIREGLDYLCTHDKVFAKFNPDFSAFTWRLNGDGFPGLARIVMGQQVSTSAAAAMWRKFESGVPKITPAAVLKLTEDELRAFGLSRQKVKYIHGLADAVKSKALDPDNLAHLSDDEVYAAITALKGFGNWSAEMFLMFGLARPDIWPAGDLGIQEGLRKYLRAAHRPDFEKTMKYGRKFAPRRTAAALLLWHMKAVAP
jgi:DNA-3-methyladenine glycosylase II